MRYFWKKRTADPYLIALDLLYENILEGATYQDFYDALEKEGVKVDNASKRRYGAIFDRLIDQNYWGIDESKKILSPEAYFFRIEDIELKEARKSSNSAFIFSIVAIVISLYSVYAARQPISINANQIAEIVQGINRLSPVCGKYYTAP